MDASQIGDEIRAQRARLNLTQHDVAELAGVGRRAVVELESAMGNRGSSLRTVSAVCSVLGLELAVRRSTPTAASQP